MAGNLTVSNVHVMHLQCAYDSHSVCMRYPSGVCMEMEAEEIMLDKVSYEDSKILNRIMCMAMYLECLCNTLGCTWSCNFLGYAHANCGRRVFVV